MDARRAGMDAGRIGARKGGPRIGGPVLALYGARGLRIVTPRYGRAAAIPRDGAARAQGRAGP